MFCSQLADEAARGSFPPEVVKGIFSNVSSIYVFHSQFLLPDLEKCIGHWWGCRRSSASHVVKPGPMTPTSLLFFSPAPPCISRSEKPGLGNVLLQHAPFLRMYADYVRNFDQAMELVRTWTVRSSAFRNIIQDIQVCDLLLHRARIQLLLFI